MINGISSRQIILSNDDGKEGVTHANARLVTAKAPPHFAKTKLAWVFSKEEKEKVEAAIKAQLPKELLMGGAKGLLGGK